MPRALRTLLWEEPWSHERVSLSILVIMNGSLLWLRPDAMRLWSSRIISVLTQPADHLWDALAWGTGIVRQTSQTSAADPWNNVSYMGLSRLYNYCHETTAMKMATISRPLGVTNRRGNFFARRGYASSLPERLYQDLTSRQLPLFFDYLHPQPSHLLDLTLTGLFPKLDQFSQTQTNLPTIIRPSPLPPAHHLVYFPPQVTPSQLLPDGTDTLHSPGAPFNRRLWVGGGVQFAATNKLMLSGHRAVCIEGIRDVIVKGQKGEEKIFVNIERRINTVGEDETENDIRKRIWRSDSKDMGEHASVVEDRTLVFMRDKTADQLDQDKANFSQVPKTIKCV